MERREEIPPPPSSRIRACDMERMAELAELRTALRQSQARVAQLEGDALHDPATGLFSRQHFDHRLRHEWRRAQLQWCSLALIAVDLEVGAQEDPARALDWAGRYVAGQIRDVDLAFRVGPRSLAVLLPGTNRTGAEAELQRLERRGRYLRPETLDLHLHFGLAVAFDDAHTALELLILADERALAGPCREEHRPTERPTIPACLAS